MLVNVNVIYKNDKRACITDIYNFFVVYCLYLTCFCISSFFCLQYKVVQRKRRRTGDREPEMVAAEESEDDRHFNCVARCSLTELAKCIKLLKPRHMGLLEKAGIAHLKDFKIRGNINRRLICFLMYKLDPVTMILDLGDGERKIQITPAVIEKLFGLPRGNKSAPRPSESGHDKALMALKEELGMERKKQIKTKDLRKLLATLVEDKEKDALAMKISGIILYNKFICPGYSVRVEREAAMVENFDIVKLKELDLCKLLYDELKRAVRIWHDSADTEWKAIPGCCIVPLLIHLDCIDDRKLSPKDKRVPRVLYLDPTKLTILADKDCQKKGDKRPDSWLYGKLPVRNLLS